MLRRNKNASLTSSMVTVYASVILSILLLIVSLYELIIFKRRLMNFNMDKHNDGSKSDDLEWQAGFDNKRPSF